VEANEAGLASALLNTMQQVGGALGLAVLATVAIDASNAKLHSLHSSSSTAASNIATTHGYTTAFLVSAGIALASLSSCLSGDSRLSRGERRLRGGLGRCRAVTKKPPATFVAGGCSQSAKGNTDAICYRLPTDVAYSTELELIVSRYHAKLSFFRRLPEGKSTQTMPKRRE
jgi:hypothetical protein